MMERLALEVHKVVGVSFEGRQEAIATLREGQALAIEREPENPHDPDAVAVRTLGNQSLGYIARDRTARFPQQLCFGHVRSVGQGAAGAWGFKLAVQPTLPPVVVHAFPASLAAHTSLAAELFGREWEALQAAELERAQGRCEVTGGAPAAAAEDWRFDDAAAVLRLAGLRAVHSDVYRVERLLAGAEGQELDARGAALLQAMNAWSEEDAVEYLAHARDVQRRRSERAWRLDLGLLQRNAVELPASLQALTI